MSPWVLIILLAQTSYDGGMASTYVPFKTEQACLAALNTLRANYLTRGGFTERTSHEIILLCARTGEPT